MTPVTVVVGTVVALMGMGVAVVVNTNASALTQHHGASRPKIGKRINRKVREFCCVVIIWRRGAQSKLSLF